MDRNINGGAHDPAEKTYGLARKQNEVFNAYRNSKGRRGQCSRCRSDYMDYAVDGYCQDCQQRVEFIVRGRRSEEEGI